MAQGEQDPKIPEADLETALAERGLDCSPTDRQGILAVARFLQQAATRVRHFESEAAAAQVQRHEGQADEAGS